MPKPDFVKKVLTSTGLSFLTETHHQLVNMEQIDEMCRCEDGSCLSTDIYMAGGSLKSVS